MQVKNPQNPIQSEISVEITNAGVKRVTIYADDADQQARAHRLLARIGDPDGSARPRTKGPVKGDAFPND